MKDCRTGIGADRAKRTMYRVLLLILVAGAISLRAWLYLSFPALILNDSSDYIVLAEDIAYHLDLTNVRLGDVRLPGYPFFLCLVHLFGPWRSSTIVVAQKMLGISTVLEGFVLGRLIGSRPVAWGLAAFLAFNPIYLLNEHLVMTESLFLFTLVGCALAATWCLRGKSTVLKGAALAITMTACILTRENGLVFCSVLTAGVLVHVFSRCARTGFSATQPALRFTLGLIGVAALLFWPWLWRNHSVLGVTVLSNFRGRNLLAYQAAHYLFDPNLPLTREFDAYYDPTYPSTIYDLINQLGVNRTPVETERVAWALVREQFLARPLAHVREVIYAVLIQAGYPSPVPVPGFARGELAWWVDNLIDDVPAVHDLNQSYGWYVLTNFTYVAQGGDSRLSHGWSTASRYYLKIVRPLLFNLAVLYAGIVFCLWLLRKNGPGLPLVLLGLAFLSVVLFHVLSLSDSDRYLVPFDWVPAMLSVAAAQGIVRRRCG